MVRFVTIIRWTPQTARALRERWMTVVNGTAPKAVLNAFTKTKVIAQEISLENNLAFMLMEIPEKDLVASSIVTAYLQDVCTMESYAVMSFEDYMKVTEALPLEKVPRPKPWTKE